MLSRPGQAVASTGARGHASLNAFLAAIQTECVVLTTPSGLHPAQAIAVAQSGRKEVTRKPIASRLMDGLAIERYRLYCDLSTIYRNKGLGCCSPAVAWRRSGVIQQTMLSYPKNMEVSHTIFGERSSLRAVTVAVGKMAIWLFADKLPEDAYVKGPGYASTSVL